MTRSGSLAALAVALSLIAAPLAVEAQGAGRVPRIGLLFTGSPPPESSRAVEAFRRGLRELGYVEGRTIALGARPDDPPVRAGAVGPGAPVTR